MDEARSLTYSINVEANTSQADANIRSPTSSIGSLQGSSSKISVDADTSQAEANIRNVTGSLGSLGSQAGSVGSAFRNSFLEGIDSGNSFSASLKAGVGGALSYVGDKATEFKNNIVQDAQSIKNGFAHPIETIKTGLGNAIQSTKDKFVTMVRGADNASDAVKELGDESQDASKDVHGLGDAAEKSGSKFEGFGAVLEGVGAASLAAVTALAAVGAAAIKAGTEYETAFAQVNTIMDTSVVSTEEMSGSIKKLSSEMGISASELSNTVYNAISATGDTENAVALAGQASMLATAGFTDTSSALSVLTTAMNAYGLSADEAAHISDSLVQVQNLGVTTVAELSSNMGRAIASASAYGVDLTNLESAYVSITKAGISTAEGTTYISAMMQELGDSGSDVAKILKSKTGQSFDQLMADGKSLGDVLGVLKDSVNGDETALMNLWSTSTAGKASAAIVGQGLDTFNENLVKIGETAGATEAAYGIMADTLEHKTAVFKTTGVNLLSSIYEGMSGELGNIMDFANGAMGQLADAFEENGITGLIGAFGTVLSEGLAMVIDMLPGVMDAGMQLLGSLVQGVLDNLPSLFGAAAQIIVTLATGIGNALPELIPSIVETLLLVVDTVIENLPLILDAGMQLVSGLAEGILGAIPMLVEQLPQLIISTVDFLTENLPTFLEQGSEILLNVALGIVDAIPQLVGQLPALISSIVGFVTENLPLLVETGISLVIQLAFGIITAIPQLVAQLPALIGAIVSGIGSLLGSIVDVGGSIVRGLWEGISAMGGWIKDKVTGFFGGIVDGVKGLLGIHSPSTVFAGIGDNMALGLGEGFGKTIDGVTKDIEKSIPTELDLPSVNAPDAISGETYKVSPVVEDVNAPVVADVTYGVHPVVGEFNPPDAEASIVYGGAPQDNPNPNPPENGGSESAGGVPAFAPVITIHVEGNADEKSIEDMRTTLYDTVKELFAEFREEELERMALKSQYAF